MNSLDQLISQYCPSGVPMMRLGELGTFYGGLTGKSKSDFIDGNAKFITYKNIYLNPALDLNPMERVLINPGEKQNTIAYGDILFTGSSETPDECGFSSVVAEMPSENLYLNSFCFGFRLNDVEFLIPSFAKHLFRSGAIREQILKTANGVTRFNISKKDFAQITIPLPPLPVQEEIVRILDAMSDLVTNLDAEISARQKQYEHAREKLICQQNYEQVTFESLGEIVRGKRFVRNDITESGTPCIHYGDMYTYYGVSASKARTHLQGEIVSKMRYAKKNDVIIVGAGENNEDIGVALAWLGDQPAAVHDACYIISHEQNPVYISQYTRTGIYHEQLKKIVVDGKICSFPLKGLTIISIPLPPLSVQQSIVERLDKMESLIQNLQAERDLRQKQYEYYREKLLTFE